MLNILLAGIGGQGTVLAAKLLAQTALTRGWQVRTAETIGMAQRGGNVTSHVRMGDGGEEVLAPLLAKGTADLVIAFEPGEAARCLEYLSPNGTLVTASTAIQPVTSALSASAYRAQDVVEGIRASLEGGNAKLVVVDDAAIMEQVGNRKALNVVLLACALSQADVPLDLDDLRGAVQACVKPRFVDMNLAAIDVAASAYNG
ncbi:MAG: indolepyruvate oxidoreductase subunit beta [Coriobacteriia bacterium]|nr:indolepyruvate oxidoreductase subunit beta [Coriobacteriia bacterium]